MQSERWDRIQTLFHAAAELSGDTRKTFLEHACNGDGHLLQQVLSLLAEDERGESLFEQGLAPWVNQFIGNSDGLPPHRQVGNYHLIKPLGEGGMGVVYLAERVDLGQVAAVKLLRDAWLSPARQQRFLSEQKTLAQLVHPSIARLYDANTLPDGTPWFAMEYVDGVPLTTYCQQEQCEIHDRLKLFRAVCEAVQYAHGHAIIHRDLKPSNILVTSDRTVHLLDFGIAKQLDADGDVDQTRTGLRLMTPAYAAPEQLKGEPTGIYTDIYSLGVILYELLTGQLPFPFTHGTHLDAEAITSQREPQKPSAMTRPVKGHRMSGAGKPSWNELDVLCLTAIHKDIQRRYKTVDALIRDIDHYLHKEPLDARPDSFTYRTSKFIRRNLRQVSAAAMMAFIVVCVVAFFMVRLTRARDEAVASAARMHEVEKFMLNLFDGGDKEAGPPDSMRVVSLVNRGVQQARTLNSQPVVQAQLYDTLGNVYHKLGDFKRADSLLQLSLKRWRELSGPDDPDVVGSLVDLGLLRASEARFDEAESLTRQALAIAKKVLRPDAPALGTTMAALGQVLEGRGEYTKAIEVLEQAVRQQSASNADPADLAASLTELANCHFYAGHYKIADALNHQVLKMDERIYGGQHPSVADDLINLGAIQLQWGACDHAEIFDRRALEIERAWYGNDHPETASAMTILGRALACQGKNVEASSLLQQALTVEKEIYGAVHPRVASTLNELGGIALKRGQLDEAEKIYREQESIYRSVYGEKHYLTVLGEANRGKVYLARKQYGNAEKIFRDVVRRDTEILSANHQFTAVARIELGRSLLREHHFVEAEKQSRLGYELLIKTSPHDPWLTYARQDLTEIYSALGRPEEAQQYQK